MTNFDGGQGFIGNAGSKVGQSSGHMNAGLSFAENYVNDLHLDLYHVTFTLIFFTNIAHGMATYIPQTWP